LGRRQPSSTYDPLLLFANGKFIDSKMAYSVVDGGSYILDREFLAAIGSRRAAVSAICALCAKVL